MLTRIDHLGYAVADLDAAARLYGTDFELVPGGREAVEDQGVTVAMFRVGESRIELLQPTHPDSPVGRFLQKRGEGFHHAAYLVEDLDETLAGLRTRGVELVDGGPRRGAGGTRVAFVHPRGAFGVLTELVELPGR